MPGGRAQKDRWERAVRVGGERTLGGSFGGTAGLGHEAQVPLVGSRIECRLSLRESAFFRGAKGDYVRSFAERKTTKCVLSRSERRLGEVQGKN